MEKTFNIEDRILNQLIEYCENNDIQLNDYINECIKDKLYTEIYGDLNEIMFPTKQKKNDVKTFDLQEYFDNNKIDEARYNGNEHIIEFKINEQWYKTDVNTFIEIKNGVKNIDNQEIISKQTIRTKRQIESK